MTDAVKEKFHTLIFEDDTLYFDKLSFCTKSEFSSCTTMTKENFRRKTDTDSGEIVISGKYDKSDAEKVEEIINALNCAVVNVSVDGKVYGGITLSSGSMCADKKNLLGEFEIRLVKSDE